MPPVPRQIPCLADDHSATPNAYRRGCSCPPAREAWRKARAEYNERRRSPQYQGQRGAGPLPVRTPQQRAARFEEIRSRNRLLAIGARRRLRGLLRDGFKRAWLAHRLRMSPGRVSRISSGSSIEGIWPRTAEAIKALYDELEGRQGTSDKTSAEAAKLGYHPREAWRRGDLDNPTAVPTWPNRTHETPRSATA